MKKAPWTKFMTFIPLTMMETPAVIRKRIMPLPMPTINWQSTCAAVIRLHPASTLFPLLQAEAPMQERSANVLLAGRLEGL